MAAFNSLCSSPVVSFHVGFCGIFFILTRLSWWSMKRHLFSLKNSFISLFILFLLTAIPVLFGTAIAILFLQCWFSCVSSRRWSVSARFVHLIPRNSPLFNISLFVKSVLWCNWLWVMRQVLTHLTLQNRGIHWFISHRELFSPFRTPSSYYFPSRCGSHFYKEAVGPLSAFVMGLVSPLHALLQYVMSLLLKHKTFVDVNNHKNLVRMCRPCATLGLQHRYSRPNKVLLF